MLTRGFAVAKASNITRGNVIPTPKLTACGQGCGSEATTGVNKESPAGVVLEASVAPDDIFDVNGTTTADVVVSSTGGTLSST
jgi:hypothetical protein